MYPFADVTLVENVHNRRVVSRVAAVRQRVAYHPEVDFVVRDVRVAGLQLRHPRGVSGHDFESNGVEIREGLALTDSAISGTTSPSGVSATSELAYALAGITLVF
ncbi:hypothetical protein GCM10007209_27210 [Haloferax sulfurifontis]|uniref:Uncharacterized protein n=1 Tax=Haloferax sulfurifontis TaxID=255616 RepID=A0A830DVJ7_9EURY|nr:hypothetical protein GCM10007209_27210 [Haloferax sulfurifontis]